MSNVEQQSASINDLDQSWDVQDRIDMRLCQIHGTLVTLSAAVDSDAPPAPEYENATIWWLQEAVQEIKQALSELMLVPKSVYEEIKDSQ